jgi:hypothetical protein
VVEFDDAPDSKMGVPALTGHGAASAADLVHRAVLGRTAFEQVMAGRLARDDAHQDLRDRVESRIRAEPHRSRFRAMTTRDLKRPIRVNPIRCGREQLGSVSPKVASVNCQMPVVVRPAGRPALKGNLSPYSGVAAYDLANLRVLVYRTKVALEPLAAAVASLQCPSPESRRNSLS